MAERANYPMQWPGGKLDLTQRPLMMGIINVTPDSFSDGGEHYEAPIAIEHGLKMVRQGAEILDVGGESTRPGSPGVPFEEQIRRVIPVLLGMKSQGVKVPISIDTQLAKVARPALDAGADMVNDISALRSDPEMAELIATRKCPVVLMHKKGDPHTMQQNPTYKDVMAEVIAFLESRIDAALSAGIERSRIILDPGIGFGKTTLHNLEILQRLSELTALGYPVLVGASRKRFIGKILGKSERHRNWGTAATVSLAVAAGAHILRVHDVASQRQVAMMSHAIITGHDH